MIMLTCNEECLVELDIESLALSLTYILGEEKLKETSMVGFISKKEFIKANI